MVIIVQEEIDLSGLAAKLLQQEEKNMEEILKSNVFDGMDYQADWASSKCQI